MLRNFFKRKKNTAKDPLEGAGNNETSSIIEPVFKSVSPLPSAEELCAIKPGTMTAEEIQSHLKMLYKRHNEAASSLNQELRKEAESMLDAIVECREKYIDS